MMKDVLSPYVFRYGLAVMLFAMGTSAECAAQEALPALERAREMVNAWPVHDLDRPQPPKVDPGPPALPAPVPSDAIVLFGGEGLSAWESEDGGAAPWKVGDGYFQVVPGSGSIQTKQRFGDVQLHVEWRSPAPPEGEGQSRGNSGIFLMKHYEVQVLNCYQNPTYPDGQAASVYSQYPPLVNACRPPGEWQSYDIVFHRPHFDEDGDLLKPATVTVFHNGVLVQDHVVITGPTAHKERPSYEAHPAKLPIMLQDHGRPVRFRNIWIRELEE